VRLGGTVTCAWVYGENYMFSAGGCPRGRSGGTIGMNARQEQDSYLFLVRFWKEQGRDRKEWRGRVQHVLSGEAHTFGDWPALIDLMLEMAETEGIEAGGSGDAPAEALRQAAP
jgi:hypothetical protein